MKKQIALSEILDQLDYWWLELTSGYHDGWVEELYRNKIEEVRKSLDNKPRKVKFEKVPDDEMCF